LAIRLKAASLETECAPRRHPRSWFRLAPVFLGLFLLAYLAGAQEMVAPEYNVKAGFLARFVEYTTWPQSAFADTNAPIIIGVLGKNPFGEVLAKTVQGSLSSRPWQILYLTNVTEAAGCQLVFISKAEVANEPEWLAALQGKPILTVGESANSIEHGCILQFKTINNRIRFDVNWATMEQSGLKISAPMLASARKIYNFPGKSP
jgi:hypothetical protein